MELLNEINDMLTELLGPIRPDHHRRRAGRLS